MKIVGYTNLLSAQPGESIRFMVSCREPSYRADIVRLIHGDDNPKGPGFKQQVIETKINGEYRGRSQSIHAGSHVVVPHDNRLDCADGLTLAAWILPTTPTKGVQGIVTKWSDKGCGYGLFIDENGGLSLWLGDNDGRVSKVHSGAAMRAGEWYFVAATFAAASGQVQLLQRTLTDWPHDKSVAVIEQSTEQQTVGRHTEALVMAACWRSTGSADPVTGSYFNGKIDGPVLYDTALSAVRIDALAKGERVSENLVAAWDFSRDISTGRVTDASGNGLDGREMQLPTRAVTGHNWTGEHVDFSGAPEQYNSIHFHEDDLEDAGWETDFAFEVPADLPSGAYAAWLQSTAGEAEDYVPFFVRPKRGTTSAAIAFLAPTLSYRVYANHQFNNPDRIALMDLGDEADSSVARDQYMCANKLLSLYDLHVDGSGVAYASLLRPQVDIRPKHTLPPLSLGAGWPHQLNADLHLLDWLTVKGFDHDVVTDEDLHNEGTELLAPYRTVLTGSHPEYWTSAMLGGLEGYLGAGGRLMYLGGNGFYWVTSIDPDRPHIVEVRRWGGSQSWEAKQGEYHHSTTGEIGGLWRFRNRAPQKMVGVGFTSQGRDINQPYRREAGSFDPRAAFIFEGIGRDELIGDFESLVLGYGAAGFELDRFDHTLGTPDHALLLASSFGHSDGYDVAIEEMLSLGLPTGGTDNPLVRADMVYFEGPNDGAVFSVGSISWCGSLSYNNYDNTVSRITDNVLRRFMC